jgi:alpha-L-fucosidase
MVESINPRLDKDWKWTETKERPMVHYTRKGNVVYAICLAWPGKTLTLECYQPTSRMEVHLLGHPQQLNWHPGDKGIVIEIPQLSMSEIPCRHAWVFKLNGSKIQAGTTP